MLNQKNTPIGIMKANDSASGLFKASQTTSSQKNSGEKSASGLFSSSQSSNNQTTNTSTTSKGK